MVLGTAKQGTWLLARFVTVTFAISISVSLVGCSGEVPEPGPEAVSPGVASEAAGTSSGMDATGGAGTATPADVPEGNTEPPLPDVASAVDALPTAEGSVGAADVTLEVVTPEQFQATVAKHAGKVVFVDFWATWCVPCRKAFPHTVEMSKKHEGKLAVISMCFDDPESHEDALAFLKEQGATFDNVMCSLGGGDESFTAYEIGDAGLPYFRLYGRDGQLVRVFKNDIDAGKGIDEAEVHAAIEELVAAE